MLIWVFVNTETLSIFAEKLLDTLAFSESENLCFFCLVVEIHLLCFLLVLALLPVILCVSLLNWNSYPILSLQICSIPLHSLLVTCFFPPFCMISTWSSSQWRVPDTAIMVHFYHSYFTSTLYNVYKSKFSISFSSCTLLSLSLSSQEILHINFLNLYKSVSLNCIILLLQYLLFLKKWVLSFMISFTLRFQLSFLVPHY